MGDNNILSLRCLMMWQSWIPTITTLQVWLHLLCLPLQRVHVAVRCLWTTRSPHSNKLKKLDMCHWCPPTKMSWTLQDVVKAGLWLKKLPCIQRKADEICCSLSKEVVVLKSKATFVGDPEEQLRYTCTYLHHQQTLCAAADV